MKIRVKAKCIAWRELGRRVLPVVRKLSNGYIADASAYGFTTIFVHNNDCNPVKEKEVKTKSIWQRFISWLRN